MLSWSITFLVVGLIAGVLGLSGIAGAATQIAWILFVVFLVLFFSEPCYGPPPAGLGSLTCAGWRHNQYMYWLCQIGRAHV